MQPPGFGTYLSLLHDLEYWNTLLGRQKIEKVDKSVAESSISSRIFFAVHAYQLARDNLIFLLDPFSFSLLPFVLVAVAVAAVVAVVDADDVVVVVVKQLNLTLNSGTGSNLYKWTLSI